MATILKKDFIVLAIAILILLIGFVFGRIYKTETTLSVGNCSQAISYACSSWGLPKHICDSGVTIGANY